MNLIIILLITTSLMLLSAMTLWVTAIKRNRYKKTKSYLNKIIHERHATLLPELTLSSIEPTSHLDTKLSFFHHFFRHNPIPINSNQLVSYLVFIACLTITIYFFSNTAIALISFIVLIIFSLIFLKMHMNKNKTRLIQQLPHFLESMVRLLSVGNSLTASFQHTLPSLEKPLQPVLEQVSALLYSGQNFDDALHTVAKKHQLAELSLIASVISIALQFGGRSDQVLQRMANFMRDLEHARMELHALSAEVRLSAWILALMPLALAGAILTINSSLLVDMWYDPTGRTMLYIAFFLQVTGSFWLYKMAKSI